MAVGQIAGNASLVNTNDALTMRSLGTVGIVLTGTWSGTVTFEGSVDGTNWVGCGAVPFAGGAAVASATANGGWTITALGMQFVRARFSTATSGTVVANAYTFG